MAICYVQNSKKYIYIYMYSVCTCGQEALSGMTFAAWRRRRRPNKRDGICDYGFTMCVLYRKEKKFLSRSFVVEASRFHFSLSILPTAAQPCLAMMNLPWPNISRSYALQVLFKKKKRREKYRKTHRRHTGAKIAPQKAARCLDRKQEIGLRSCLLQADTGSEEQQ